MTNKAITRFCSFLLTALALSGEVSRAQSSPDLDQLLQIGLPNTAPVLAVPLGAVNLSNGNLHLEIPIKTVPQTGTMPALTFTLVYDSQFWEKFNNFSNTIWEPASSLGTASSPGNGWRWVVSPSTSYVTSQEIDVPDNSSCNVSGESTVPSWSNFSYSDSSGTTHVFDLSFTQSSTCPAWCPVRRCLRVGWLWVLYIHYDRHLGGDGQCYHTGVGSPWQSGLQPKCAHLCVDPIRRCQRQHSGQQL